MQARQYVLTINESGNVRITERSMPKRGWRGRFVGNKVKVITQAICPACGAELGLVSLA